jgi:hypothetical protein
MVCLIFLLGRNVLITELTAGGGISIVTAVERYTSSLLLRLPPTFHISVLHY